jgi:hypothetical protein
MARQTVTLRVTKTATVVVDIEKEEVKSVEWDTNDSGHVAFEAHALHIPNSSGETAATRILIKQRHWLR